DDSRIEKVETLIARPVDLPVRFSDEHRLALVDGNLRGANLNLERHRALLRLYSARCLSRTRLGFRGAPVVPLSPGLFPASHNAVSTALNATPATPRQTQWHCQNLRRHN